MHNPYAQIFEEESKHFLALIGRMRADLSAYAMKPDANEKAVAVRQETIDRMFLFYEQTMDVVNTLDVSNLQSYANGYKRGAQDKENEIKNTPHPLDKETVRRANYITQMNGKWQDHL